MSASVSVVVPVLDGARYLGGLLTAVREQGDVELLVIDSGSSDDSREIARSHGAELLEIAAGDFGHGRTRNVGAERTSGDIICFLTQDATPVPGWLDAHLEGHALADSVGAVYGPHLPRADTSPMIARELTEFFATFSSDGRPVVQQAGDPTFLSNVNASYARACWQQVRFRDVAYSEDQAFGADMLEAGWSKVYHPCAAVLHAHDYPALEFMRRYFDEYRGLRETIGHVEPLKPTAALGDVRRLVAGDRRWMREAGWSGSRRAVWTARSLRHHGGRKIFSAIGSRANSLPASVERRLSLEGRASNVAGTPPEADGRSTHVPQAISEHEYEVIARFWRQGPVPTLDPIDGMAGWQRFHLAFVIPPFRRGSGGHNIIFQLIHRLERMGHVCSIWLDDPFQQLGGKWPGAVQRSVSEDFVAVRAAAHVGFDDWHGADVVVATGWQTVYPALQLANVRAHAYLVNDHEPEFYPTSVESHWASATYRLGLHAIAGSPWLRDLYRDGYGGTAGSFQYGVDHSVYHPRPVERRRDTIVFYCRNVTPRRAVALGVLALAELHRRRPELRIVLFGDPHPADTPFPHEHLGVASPEQLSQLFSESTVGICLSMTNYSLLPQEMVACGLPCVDLQGRSTESVFGASGPVELVPFDANALADAVERLIDDEQLWQRRSEEGAAFVAQNTWDQATEQVERQLREALRARERGENDLVAAWARAGAGPSPPRHDGWARKLTSATLETSEVTDALYARLAPGDVAAIEAALPPDYAAAVSGADGAQRRALLLALGVYRQIPVLLEKTGLSTSEPPLEVHAMSRGPLSGGGVYWYADLVIDALRRAGMEPGSLRHVLDFGCSSGRVVRVLAAAYPDVDWYGCDPNADAIAWAAEHLAPTQFAVSPQAPPLPYEDGLFDAVFAVSIWSHYAEHAALRWLEEMYRVIRPDGVLVLTTHGFQSLAFYAANGQRPHGQLVEIRDELYHSGHWYAPEFGSAGDHGVYSPDWGTAFMTQEWLLQAVRGRWALVDATTGLLEGNQDAYVLRRLAG